MRIEDNFLKSEAVFNSKFQNLNSNKDVNKDDSEISFKDVLKKSIDDVNSKAIESDLSAQAFVRGEDVSVDEMMIKGTEASLGLQFLATTRDKLLEGYNELTKMQL